MCNHKKNATITTKNNITTRNNVVTSPHKTQKNHRKSIRTKPLRATNKTNTISTSCKPPTIPRRSERIKKSQCNPSKASQSTKPPLKQSTFTTITKRPKQTQNATILRRSNRIKQRSQNLSTTISIQSTPKKSNHSITPSLITSYHHRHHRQPINHQKQQVADAKKQCIRSAVAPATTTQSIPPLIDLESPSTSTSTIQPIQTIPSTTTAITNQQQTHFTHSTSTNASSTSRNIPHSQKRNLPRSFKAYQKEQEQSQRAIIPTLDTLY